MSEPLTPRQAVDALVEMHSTFVQYNRGDRDPVLVPTTGGKLRAWPAALEAALAAYKREHLRAWLEERCVSIEAYRPPGATADAARAAAAKALGYPGLETAPEEGPSP